MDYRKSFGLGRIKKGFLSIVAVSLSSGNFSVPGLDGLLTWIAPMETMSTVPILPW